MTEPTVFDDGGHTIVRNRIYVSGPITGRPNAREAFDVAYAALQTIGLQPVLPTYLQPFEHEGDCPFTYRGTDDPHDASCYMRACIEAMVTCESIFMLDGWKGSRGAVLEHDIAIKIGMKIYYNEAAKHNIGIILLPLEGALDA